MAYLSFFYSNCFTNSSPKYFGSNFCGKLATHEEEETDEELEALIDELHAVIEKILAKRNSKTPPEGYKQNPKFIQKKNRRVQLVLQQGLYDRIKEAANTEHLSVNEYVHSILDIVTPHLDEK